jgi:hypothetical protein
MTPTHIVASICAGMVFVTASIGARSDGAVCALIDRSNKGDRLPLVEVIRPPVVDQLSALARDLPEGCVALVSPLARSDLARIAGSCES